MCWCDGGSGGRVPFRRAVSNSWPSCCVAFFYYYCHYIVWWAHAIGTGRQWPSVAKRVFWSHEGPRTLPTCLLNQFNELYIDFLVFVFGDKSMEVTFIIIHARKGNFFGGKAFTFTRVWRSFETGYQPSWRSVKRGKFRFCILSFFVKRCIVTEGILKNQLCNESQFCPTPP